MRALDFDIETCSALDLTKVGSRLYARHPMTDIRCVSFCLIIDGVRGPIETWRPSEPLPPTIVDFAADKDALATTFNNAFDRQIWDQILTPRYSFPVITLERHRCAQAAALARALPASLDAAASALGITTRKTKAGMAVMKKLAKPRKQTAKERKAGAPLDFSATPEELATLGEYNRIDVFMLMEVVDRIGLLNDAEQARWQLDQLINERGVHVDVGLIEAGLSIGEEARLELHRELCELTGGTITTPKQRDRILAWLKEHGCALPNLSKGTVADALLEPGLDAQARQLLELRRSGAGAAALKLKTLLRWTEGEGAEPRIRYAYRFHGASSGRFTSLGCQLHNLRRPELADVQGAIDAVATGSLAEMRRRGFDRPLETIGHITRAVITAAPGKRLFIADLSGIEARGAAYICGAADELEQWRTFDRTNKAEDEPYYRTGITTFAQPPATARKTGKTGTLAFQYQGGIGAYRRITGDAETPDEIIADRRDAWRRDHPEHARFWGTALLQAVQAIQYPGQEFTAKAVAFQFDRATGFLEVTLPSKRRLTFPQAQLYEDEQRDTVSFTFLDASGSRAGRMYHERRGSGAFGGLLLENITQALCRDIFVEPMTRLEAAGYSIVAHTHDEYVCEVSKDFGSLDEFLAIITTPPSWAPDLPIAAKARISDRLIEIPEPKSETAVATDNAIDNAAQDLAERDDLAQVLCEQDENDETEWELTPESIPACARELWESPGLAAQAPQPPALEPAPLPASELSEPLEPPSVCIHCRAVLDRQERVDAHNGGFLHRQCVEPFLHARMAEEQIPWSDPASPPMPPPSPPSGPGESIGVSSAPEPEPAPRRPNGRGNSAGDGYPHGEYAGSSAGPITGEHVYKTAAGRLHMRVVRRVDPATGKKSFPTDRWENGDWVAGWPDTVVPYRLPELLTAPADAVVLVVEGEKCADMAARHGFVSTTHPGGAGKWQPELAQYFVGRQRVCIAEDNDAAGATNTAAIIRALRDVVPVIGVLRFPELPEHGDSTDFFERGGTAQALQVRIDEALKAGIAAPYTLCNMDEVPLEETHWLWPEHLPIGGLVLITGVTGVGKTYLVCDVIARITTGQDWPDGAKGGAPGSVIALTAEDNAKEFRRRLTGAGAELTQVKILKSVRRNARDELFLLAEDLDKLTMACRDLGDVKLITIDPITAFMGSGRGFDSHRATDVRSQLAPLKDFAERLNICVVAVTHPPKGAAARVAIDSFIGSQAFIATARAGKSLVEELGEPDDRSFRRPTGRILFTTPKTSDGPKPPTLAFQQEDVAIGYVPGTDRLIRTRRIVWEREPLDLTADEARLANMPTPGGDGRKARAAPVRELLREILKAGPVLRKTVVERGAEQGFSFDQLWRAFKAIKGQSFKQDKEWFWALPEHAKENEQETEQ
jgi:DNA polymerase